MYAALSLTVQSAPDNVRQMLQGTSDGAISVAMFEPPNDRAWELFIVVSTDVQERCRGDAMKATELQFMYADVLRAILDIILGGSIEIEVLRPKILSLVRKDNSIGDQYFAFIN